MASLNLDFKQKYFSRSLSAYDSMPSGLLTGGFASKDRPVIDKSFGLIEDTCAECKNRFEHTREHAYRRNSRIFCSYHCMRAFDRRMEDGTEPKLNRVGRPRKMVEDRIRGYEEKIAQDQAALSACTDRFERRKIKRRMDGRKMALEKIREETKGNE